MTIPDEMCRMLKGTSPSIRTMFEDARQMKEVQGPENVFDFTAGNPDIPPPEEFRSEFRALANDDNLSHGYMTSRGYLHVREAIAGYISREYEIELRPELMIMTAGAAAALNVLFRALLAENDEVLVPVPYFPNYKKYLFNTGAKLKTVSTDESFHLDLSAVEAALTPLTKIFLINSPNNPTGAVYGAAELSGIGRILSRASRRFNHTIYLISDEPYRKIVYDQPPPSIFAAYPHSILVTSYSKELSLAGERIGYLAVSPEAEGAELLLAAAGQVNEILYVNAPSLFQLVVSRVQGISVDVSAYQRRRDILSQALRETGYEFLEPQGTFYLFPKSPLADDIAFVELLKQEKIVTVPGVCFGSPGYFRISYAVPDEVINKALPGFKRAFEKALQNE